MKAQGFTIIEIMIVVTIIGILAAIAIPAYTNYTLRAKVSDGLTIAAPVKLAIQDYVVQEGVLPTSNEEAGLAEPNAIQGKYVSQVEVDPSGAIVVTYGDPALQGATLTFTPTMSGTAIVWSCSSNLPSVLLPAACK